MTHEYLIKENDTPVVYISNEEMPVATIWPSTKEDLMQAVKQWKSSAKKYSVHESCRDRLIYHELIFAEIMRDEKSHSECLESGIKLPEGLVEVRTIRRVVDYGPNGYPSIEADVEYAFLVEKPVEEDLWPNQQLIEQKAYDMAAGSLIWEDGFEEGIKWLRDYCKQKGLTLIKK